MDAFPAFFPLRGRRVVIAGDGAGAAAKARLFEGSPAHVVRLTGEAALNPTGYAGAALIFVAGDDEAFTQGAVTAARQSGAPLNVVDRPELSDFHTPAIVDRGPVVAAIGTAGAAPVLASLLRVEIEARIPEHAGRIARLLGDRREALKRAFPDLAARRSFLRAVLAGPAAEAAKVGDLALASGLLDAAIAKGWSAVGRVTFIELGAADDLVSLRAVRALNIADVVVATGDGEALLASHGRRDAERLAPDSGLEALAGHAQAGRLVAVVGQAAQPGLVAGLRGVGIAVEVLAPAPAP
ncbi:MAG: bifunctional precorrin-2 dehydrogenase/sirohydrochlorin ferrochelatase [Caulobacteraceae bacterium]|nr:bifunctional precorrin-2 dehydrogenase/sirohydrochlorin ferrochelatase [Caulobacteraceae bacterium]